MQFKKTYALVAALSFCAFIEMSGVTAHAAAFRSPSLGGATGLINTPTARTGWETGMLAFDAGFHWQTARDHDESSWMPHLNLELFSRLELGMTFDVQSEHDKDDNIDENDFFLHGKFRFLPWSGSSDTALAIGFNYQSLEDELTYWDSDGGHHRDVGQIYLAVTYGGSFFGMPAETTAVIGKTFGDDRYNDDHNDDIDFSMGFDLDFLPQYLKGYVHWITDFSNYSYTVDSLRNLTEYRGAFSTGARIAVLKDMSKFKLNVDVLGLDLFDESREFALAVTFGMPIM